MNQHRDGGSGLPIGPNTLPVVGRGTPVEVPTRSRAHVDAITGQRSEWAIRHVCDRLSDLLAGLRDEIGHPDPAAAVPFAFRLILGVLKEAILFRGPGAHGTPESDAALSVEMSRAFLGYLSLPAP